MCESVGMIEVYGLTAAFLAADAGCKAANVKLEPFDKNKPGNSDALPVPLIVLVKFRGKVEDVKVAIEVAEAVAEKTTGVISKHIISKPEKDMQGMLEITGMDKE